MTPGATALEGAAEVPRYASRAGYLRIMHTIPVPLALGTGAITVFNEPLGFRYRIIKALAVVTVAGTGTSAARTARLLKGSTSLATFAFTLAGTATVGTEFAGSLSTTVGACDFDDNDALVVDYASGGTAFTAGSAALYLTLLQRPQTQQ